MKVSGTATVNAPRAEVWRALQDPTVLVRTIPGCQRLENVDVDAYKMTLNAGVASIKGVYQGEVRLTEQRPEETFVLKAAGAGAPGTVSADVLVSLSESDAGGTSLTYSAEAVVGGMIGGVGQRMLSGAAKRTAAEFFTNVEGVLTGSVPEHEPKRPAAATSTAAASAGVPDGVYEAPGAGPKTGRSTSFLQGALVGAGAALLGALVGGWVARRSVPRP
ncbi:MAG: SRPBCC family protein [Nocardioidaceae bacterium]